jgi:CRP/FNR family cyclic AMP-dependent transcriptional regulator
VTTVDLWHIGRVAHTVDRSLLAAMPFRIQQTASLCQECQHRTKLLFCNLGDEALQRFDTMGQHIPYPKGTLIFEEMQPVSNIFVVCKGRLKLSSTSQDGNTMILRLAGPGDVLGLSAVLSGQQHEVTAESIEPVELKSVPSKDFSIFFDEFSEVARNSAKMAAIEYQAAFNDARRLAISGTAQARLASLLLNWFNTGPCKEPKRINMNLTQQELANMCGLTRETISRTLSNFERQGWIERRGVSMILRNPEALSQITS